MPSSEKKTKSSRNRSWKECIAIGLDEGLLALRESFEDQGHEQVWSRPIRDVAGGEPHFTPIR